MYLPKIENSYMPFQQAPLMGNTSLLKLLKDYINV